MGKEEKAFEDSVRKVASELWPSAIGGGAVILENKERDGYYATEECIHIIECTTSRTKAKAVEDCRKLSSQISIHEKKRITQAVKGWFITKDEPTAEQRSAAQSARPPITAVSLREFRAQLVNVIKYLDLRRNCPFGSVRNPEDDSLDDRNNYVQIDACDEFGTLWSPHTLADSLIEGNSFVATGDYGIGKSTLMREVFFTLCKRYDKSHTITFPILLNLREHHGQTSAVEALERHARSIGYESPHHLVRAWRAGYVILLLDGFDELGRAGIVGKAKKLKTIRFEAMELIRAFIQNHPNDTGFAVTGRGNFFDSGKELLEVLGIARKPNLTRLMLNDFNDEQVGAYLKKRGWNEQIPAWFPSRPVLLGYLAVRGMLPAGAAELDPAAGWDTLLDRISEREARMEIGVDSPTVRRIIERLATRARCGQDGLGSLSQSVLEEVFHQECGYEPDEQGVKFLQRLAPLGSENAEDGTRRFVDRDLVDAARAADVFEFIRAPHTTDISDPARWQCTLESVGAGVCSRRCEQSKLSNKQLCASFQYAGGRENWSFLTADIYQVMSLLRIPFNSPGIEISEVSISRLSIDNELCLQSNITFRDCLIQELEVGSTDDSASLPRFAACCIGVVDGRVSSKDLPAGVFDVHCTFDSFGLSTGTTSAIAGSEFSSRVQVALTILRKLYLQAGAGRRLSALQRGLDQNLRRSVPDVLRTLRAEGLAIRNPASNEEVWLPVRNQTARIHQIISAPHSSKDPLLRRIDENE